MTVTRRLEASFEAPDDETADWLCDLLRRVLMGDRWGTWDDVERAQTSKFAVVTGQAMSWEPVAVGAPDGD